MNLQMLSDASIQAKLAIAAGRAGKKFRGASHACRAGDHVSCFFEDITGESDPRPPLTVTVKAIDTQSRIEAIYEKPFLRSDTTEHLDRAALLIEEAEEMVPLQATYPNANQSPEIVGLGPVAAFAIQKAIELLLKHFLR